MNMLDLQAEFLRRRFDDGEEAAVLFALGAPFSVVYSLARRGEASWAALVDRMNATVDALAEATRATGVTVAEAADAFGLFAEALRESP